MIVLHYTVLDLEASLDRLCDPEAEVSAHYVICLKGSVIPLVDEARRAWHAGAGRWGAVTDVNSRSIGIELVNDGDSPFPAPQMAALVDLLRGIRSRWSIPDHHIIGHSDMAPDRKADPGRRFDWRALALQGQGVWPQMTGCVPDADGHRFCEAARAFGYTADVGQDVLLYAVRQRFRPWAYGPLDGVDCALIENLAERFPVDRHPATS
jgi:N-acetylmuramoyl-L-alanine amidase